MESVDNFMPVLEKLLTEIPAIGAIVLIVILFQKSQKNLIKEFMGIITNHLTEHKTAIDKNTNVLGRVEDFIREVIILVRKQNGK